MLLKEECLGLVGQVCSAWQRKKVQGLESLLGNGRRLGLMFKCI